MTEPKIHISRAIWDEDTHEVAYIVDGLMTADVGTQRKLNAVDDMYEALKEVVALVCDSCLEYERFKELCYGRQKVVIAENPCNNCTNKVINALRKARGESE